MNRNDDKEFWIRWNRANEINDSTYDDFDEECKDGRVINLNKVDKIFEGNGNKDDETKENPIVVSSLDYLTNRLISTLSPSSTTTPSKPTSMSYESLIVNELDDYIYKVQTKHAATFHDRSSQNKSTIVVGDFVILEADRGEALGIITEKVLKQDFKEVKATAGYRGKGSSAIYEEDKLLLRLATKEERIQLPGKLLKEEEATNLCRDMIKKRGLDLAIINSEYQFDGGKLTFFYQANLRIDFRELVCELFTTFKTRIWMQQGMVT